MKKDTPFAKSEISVFTLIELLVVITIIAILMALLLPALSRAKFQATLAACVSNQKQQAVAILNYTGDYDTWFPSLGVRQKTIHDGSKVYWVGDDHPWGPAGKSGGSSFNQYGMADYLGITAPEGIHWSKKHYAMLPGVMGCPQGKNEAPWYSDGGSHSHPGRSFYNWYFDTWGGMLRQGDAYVKDPLAPLPKIRNMMRKLGRSWVPGGADNTGHRSLKFDIIGSDVYKRIKTGQMGNVPGVQTNHIWGGDRMYPNGKKGDGHFSNGPLYFGSAAGQAYGAFTFQDGRVEIFGPLSGYNVYFGDSLMHASSGTASGGWAVPLKYAE